MDSKKFNVVCPYCNEIADVVAYKRIQKNKLKILYICPYCGNGDEEEHFLYEEEKNVQA